MAEKQKEEKNEEELSNFEKLNSTQMCNLDDVIRRRKASEILKNLGPKKFNNF